MSKSLLLGYKVLGAGAAAIIAAVAVSGVGCSSSSSSTPPPAGDTGTGGDSIVNNDAPGSETSTTDTGTGGETGPAPQATLLAPGNWIPILVLKDNSVLMVDNSPSTAGLEVLSKGTAGTPTVIDPNFGSITDGGIFQTNSDIIFTHGKANAAGIALLYAWKPGETAVHQVVATATNVGDGTNYTIFPTTTTDGSQIAYVDNAGNGGATGDIVIAKYDGSAKKTVLTNVVTNDATCAPRMDFIGTTSTLLVEYCPSATGTDAGTGSSVPTVVSVDISGGTPKTIIAQSGGFVLNTAGNELFYFGVTDQAVHTIGIDGTGDKVLDADKVAEIALLPDDQTMAYVTQAGALKTAKPGATPTVLVASGATGFFSGIESAGNFTSYTPDKKYIAYLTKAGTLVPNFGDLNLAPLAGGAPIVLSSDPNSGIFGSAETADFSNFVFIKNLTTPDNENLVADLYVQPVAGGTATQVTTKDWLAYSPKGNTIVFNDNWKLDTNGNGQADLKIQTVGGAAKTIATQVYEAIFVKGAEGYLATPDNVVFFADQSGSKPGLYTASF